MGLEAATYISQLVNTNPLAADKKNQGDDHLRLIKAVLQASLPNMDRAFRVPEVVSKNAAYGAAETDENKAILCDASGAAFNVTLPTPTFDGWMVRVIKTDSSVNPVYVLPPAGTINGFAKIRVNVPFVEHVFLWTGGTFLRLNSAGQIRAGSFEYHGGTAAPVGYAFATGQALSQADHPELFAAWGGTWGSGGGNFNAPDTREKFIVGSGGIYGVGATGGEVTHVLTTNEIPVHNHGITDPNHAHTETIPLSKAGNASGFNPVTGQLWWGDGGTQATGSSATNVSTQNAGAGAAHENRPPYLALPLMFRLC